MMPTLGHFSSSSTAAMGKTGDGGGFDDGTAATAEAKPKARRGARPPAPKKTPQRGLGVAQLERLRIQERWKMMSDTMDSPAPVQIYDLPTISHAWVETHHLPSKGTANTQPVNQPQPLPALVYLPRCRSAIAVASGGGYGPFAGTRSAIQEQYPIDRFQFGAINPAVEPPSNQTQPLCFSNQCEFCVRKKRLFGENPGLRCGDFLEMDLSPTTAVNKGMITSEYRSPRPVKSARETELKEYDFFPRSPAITAGEESLFSDASSASAGCTPCFIDLSLTL